MSQPLIQQTPEDYVFECLGAIERLQETISKKVDPTVTLACLKQILLIKLEVNNLNNPFNKNNEPKDIQASSHITWKSNELGTLDYKNIETFKEDLEKKTGRNANIYYKRQILFITLSSEGPSTIKNIPKNIATG